MRNKVTDSNFTAENAIGIPGENDYIEFFNANKKVIESILQDERNWLGPIKVRIDIFAIMCQITDYQQGFFKDADFTEEPDYIYRYGIPLKTRNMPILPATNISNIYDFGVMRIAERVDNYQNYRSGWEFYQIERVFIEVTQFQLPTRVGHIQLLKNLAAKKEVVNLVNDNDNQMLQAYMKLKTIQKG